MEKNSFSINELKRDLKKMDYHYMAIELTDVCNIGCRFCCNVGGGKRGVLSEDGLQILLNMSKKLDFKGIGFTGGECTLYPYWGKIKQIVREEKIGYSLITNGYWAKDFLATYEILEDLKNNNLNSITVSYDDYHREYVKEQNLKEIIKCTHLLNIPLEIQSVTFTDSNLRWLNKLLEDGYDLRITFFPGYKIGGAQRFDDSKFIRKQSPNSQFCGKNKTLFFDCAGNCYPCCSPSIEKTELKIGNIYKNSFSDIVNTLQKNPILYIIRNYGFESVKYFV